MFRILVVAAALSCLPTSLWAQTPPAPAGNPARTAAPAKPAATKATPKQKSAPKLAAPAESGPCQVGVISTVGSKFAVQKVGLTIFGNELTEVPIEAWGLDDLIVTRVRAAAAGINVRKVPYAKASFEPYYNPPSRMFRNGDEDLTGVVRQIASQTNCARYFVFVIFDGQLQGTNQTLRGIGVVNRGTAVLSSTMLFTVIGLKVFDGQSFAIARNPNVNFRSILEGTLSGLTQDPLTKLENEDFPSTPADAANSAILRERTRALLTARLDKMLPAYFKEAE